MQNAPVNAAHVDDFERDKTVKATVHDAEVGQHIIDNLKVSNNKSIIGEALLA